MAKDEKSAQKEVPPEASGELSPKKRAFVAEYIKNGMNGAKAAAAAGYSKKSAKELACRLLKEPAVKAAVEAAVRAIEEEGIATRTQVLRELTMIGLFDIRKAYRDDGTLLTPKEFPDEVAHVVAGIESEEIFDGRGGEREYVGDLKKLKVCDKLGALELLGKHHKLFTDKVEIDASSGLADLLKAARARVSEKRKKAKDSA